MKRGLKIVGTLLVTGGAAAYILTQIDIGKTLHIIGSASRPWIVASAVLTFATVPGMAWRWRWLLAVRGVHERLGWLLPCSSR